jgi:hypothetical protein
MIHFSDIIDLILNIKVVEELINIIAVSNDGMGRISFFGLDICDEPFLHNTTKKEEILLNLNNG